MAGKNEKIKRICEQLEKFQGQQMGSLGSVALEAMHSLMDASLQASADTLVSMLPQIQKDVTGSFENAPLEFAPPGGLVVGVDVAPLMRGKPPEFAVRSFLCKGFVEDMSLERGGFMTKENFLRLMVEQFMSSDSQIIPVGLATVTEAWTLCTSQGERKITPLEIAIDMEDPERRTECVVLAVTYKQFRPDSSVQFVQRAFSSEIRRGEGNRIHLKEWVEMEEPQVGLHGIFWKYMKDRLGEELIRREQETIDKIRQQNSSEN